MDTLPSTDAPKGPGRAQVVGFWLGIVLAVAIQLFPIPEGLADAPMGPRAAWLMLSLLALMAVWWATEAIPIPATSLIPLIAIPLAGAGSAADAAGGFAAPIVLLLLGGFVVALGIERWNLHERIALGIVSRAGSSPHGVIFGFMCAAAFISMWISNTATTIMLMPIAISVAMTLASHDETAVRDRFVIALLLGICYAASIGGVGTYIGTPTNLIAIDWLQRNADVSISFLTWMYFGVPAMLLLVPCAWWVVTRDAPKVLTGRDAGEEVRARIAALGPLTTPEARVAGVFAMVAALWILREPLNLLGAEVEALSFLTRLSDMQIAILGAVVMFIVPSGAKEAPRQALLDWESAAKLPWGVIVLFAGGISLGRAITRTGLSDWIGASLEGLSALPPLLFLALIVAAVIFATELTSNVATMTTIAPILGAVAGALDLPAEMLLAPAAVAASCAFMLPVATAPNAIVFATGRVPIAAMLKAGLRLNLLGILVITAIGFWIAPIALG